MRLFIPPTKRYDIRALRDLGFEVVDRKWRAVSVTGRWCELMCKHCYGVLLEYMERLTSLGDAMRLVREGIKGVLISGGCDKRGRVPFERSLSALKLLRDSGVELYAHTGLLDRASASIASDLGFRVCMFDVFTPLTAKLVRNLDGFTLRDLGSCLELCKEMGLRCAPHIVIGELCGKPSGELELIDFLSSYDIEQVNLVVFTPLPGTPFEECDPPPYDYIIKVLRRAREILSKSALALGCMKPSWGRYRLLELEAIEMGFDAIAAPNMDTLARCRVLGINVIEVGCCSMLAGASSG